MSQDAISQLQTLLASAGDLRAKLSNTERLQLIGLVDALHDELERPDEALFRITFNEVRGPPFILSSSFPDRRSMFERNVGIWT